MNGMRRFLGGGAGGSSGHITPPAQDAPLPPLPTSSTSPPGSGFQSQHITPASTAPLFSSGSGKPSWPPSTPPHSSTSQDFHSPEQSPRTTAALFFRRDKQKPMRIPTDEEVPPIPGKHKVAMANGTASPLTSPRNSNGSVLSPSRSQTLPPMMSPNTVAGLPSSPSPPRVPPLPHRVSQLSKKSVDRGSEWKRSSGMLDIRDDLLMSLLASEAIVDSRGYEILSAEEVEELKKELQILSTRLAAMSKKLTLETKIRDAAVSLSKANASYKTVSKQTSEQLESANRKVELTQKELWRVSERASEVQRKLLEHRSSVLSYSVHTLEKKLAPISINGLGGGDGDGGLSFSGYSTPNRSSSQTALTIPTSPSSVTSTQTSSSLRGRFEGAHFFAGHSDAVVPQLPRAPPTLAEVVEMEEKLRAATVALEDERSKREVLAKDVAAMRKEREVMEVSLGVELQQAEEMIGTLEREVSKMEDYEAQVKYLEGEREVWVKERAELEQCRREVDTLERQLVSLEQKSGEAAETGNLLVQEQEVHRLELEKKEKELEEVKLMWESDKVAWEVEQATLEGDITQAATTARQEAEADCREELDEVFEALRDLMKTHGIFLLSRENTLTALVSSVGNHIEGLNTRSQTFSKAQEEWVDVRSKLETDVRAGLDKRETLMGELEQVKKERDEAREEARHFDEQLKEQARLAFTASPAAVQTPVEYTGDAAAIVAILQPLWAVLPSPEARASRMGSRFTPLSPTNSPVPSRSGTSLSEMDVRNLKILYDPRASPLSPQTTGGAFTVEAFAERVRSLISDDRALIERLIRFAQAHDLLKKNAERAQKLAQESNGALETYQKQVKMLEDRNISLLNKQAAFQDEVQHLQDAIDRITAEKLEVETHAAEQAETCAQLTDANNNLSARALTLADDAASAQDSVRKQMEVQLVEVNAALAKAKAEVESMRESQQTQQMALMEELNSVQTENDALRAQLRAKK